MKITSAADQKMDFMKLLVTQMQYQNPLEPMDNQQMAAQLAQFTQLELSEKMNNNLASINQTIEKMNLGFMGSMLMAQLDYARSLLGNTITFYSEPYQKTLEGNVKGIQFVEGEPVLTVQTQVINPDASLSERTILVKLDEIEGIKL